MVNQSHAVVELDGYEDVEALAESANSILLRARAQDTGTSVVVKLLKSEYPTPEEVARLAHEHRIAEDLQLDGVVRPLRIERFKHRVGLILEDSGGSSLRSIIGPTGLDTQTFLRVAIPLVRTLGHVHDADIIHKDLNPSNIVVDDTLSTVQITDFGIASRLPRVHRESGRADRLEGTLAYLSPEQTGRMNRAVDHRSDFYALGATFYEALTGHPPFAAGDAMEMVHCHLAVRPAPPREVNPAVPEALSDIVVKLLAKSPEDRYQSAYGLLRDLEHCHDAWREHAAHRQLHPRSGGRAQPFPHPRPALRPGGRDGRTRRIVGAGLRRIGRASAAGRGIRCGQVRPRRRAPGPDGTAARLLRAGQVRPVLGQRALRLADRCSPRPRTAAPRRATGQDRRLAGGDSHCPGRQRRRGRRSDP